jgi:hypothetical protein
MKNSEKLRDQAALWMVRADNAIEEAMRVGKDKAVKFRARAEQLLLEASKAEQQEEGAHAKAVVRALEICEAKARKAVNDWSAPRIRERMREVRQLQGSWLKLDDMDHARALDSLFNALRVKAEGIERAQIEAEVYSDSAGKTLEEMEALVEARWEEHRHNI